MHVPPDLRAVDILGTWAVLSIERLRPLSRYLFFLPRLESLDHYQITDNNS